jgi:hypothetical protein
MMIDQFAMNTIVYDLAIQIVTKCYFFSGRVFIVANFVLNVVVWDVLPRQALLNKKIDHKFGWCKPDIVRISTDGKSCYHYPM